MSLASEVGVDLAHVRPRVEGSDETGRYRRNFTRLARVIRVTDAPAVAQPDPEVMFQRIIHEGLVGDDVSPALHGDVRRLAGTRHLRRRRSRDLGSRPWST